MRLRTQVLCAVTASVAVLAALLLIFNGVSTLQRFQDLEQEQMRSQIDQGDEQTPGVNKRGLLTGDKAMPAPEPGSLKSEQPKSEAKPVRRSAVSTPKPVAAAPAPQPTPRTQVEMIEGAKKRNVEFP